MSDSGLPRWKALLDGLDACWVDPARSEPEEVLRMIEERQRLLDTLSTLDTSALEESVRDELAARISAILDRDRELHQSVDRWRGELQESAARAKEGRVAAAGYAEPPSGELGRLLRKA